MALLRDTAPLAYYALPPTDVAPYEHVGHFIKGRAPEGARIIDAAEAKRINDDVDARSPLTPVSAAVMASAADMQKRLAASPESRELLDEIRRQDEEIRRQRQVDNPESTSVI